MCRLAYVVCQRCGPRDPDHKPWLALATDNSRCDLWETYGLDCPNRTFLNDEDHVIEVQPLRHCMEAPTEEKKAGKKGSKGNRAAQQARTKDKDRARADKYIQERIEGAQSFEEMNAAMLSSVQTKNMRNFKDPEQQAERERQAERKRRARDGSAPAEGESFEPLTDKRRRGNDDDDRGGAGAGAGAGTGTTHSSAGERPSRYDVLGY